MIEIIFFIVTVFLFGTIIGSFLNALIFRMRSGDSVFNGRSRCPNCKKELRPIDLVPIFSYLYLGGKCAHCKKSISIQYPLVEFATGALFLLGYFKFGYSLELAGFMLLACFAIVIFVYDYKYSLILDKVSIPAIIVGLLCAIFIYWLSFWQIFFGGFIGAGIFLAQYWISKGKWIGGGDIRLGLFMGVTLGWEMVLLALLIAYVSGAIISLVLIGLKKKGPKDQIPFGTFLSAAFVLVLLYGNEIINWYLNLL
ncbi:MAG: prepilin peptidase [Patescibacteria group bacterium]